MIDTLMRSVKVISDASKYVKRSLENSIKWSSPAGTGYISTWKAHGPKDAIEDVLSDTPGRFNPQPSFDGFVVSRSAFRERYFICVGDRYCPLLDIMTWAKPIGATAVGMPTLTRAFNMLGACHNEVGAIFVSVDELGDLETTIDTLATFRRDFDTPPVLLMSHEFALNDFSTERLEICDASLRLPLSRTAFGLGLSSALDNNWIFNGRRRERSLMI